MDGSGVCSLTPTAFDPLALAPIASITSKIASQINADKNDDQIEDLIVKKKHKKKDAKKTPIGSAFSILDYFLDDFRISLKIAIARS